MNNNRPIPTGTAGIGLRSVHYRQIIEQNPPFPWLEIHSENFFAAGGINLDILSEIHRHYPLSFHGVGLSLGSAQSPDKNHLQKLKQIIDRFHPHFVSEHLSWSGLNNAFTNDLLPIPYTREALDCLVNNICTTQDFLQRKILIENPSSYLAFNCSDMPEYIFLNEVARRSGCGILLDVNNIYVTCYNHAIDPLSYLNQIETSYVAEIHLAGHVPQKINGHTILIDHHGDYIAQPVWELYEKTLEQFSPLPTLVEWDTNIPSLDILASEAEKAQSILNKVQQKNLYVS